MLNMSFEEALDGKHPAFFCCLLSRQASVTPRSFISDILTIQLPGGNDQNRMYATL